MEQTRLESARSAWAQAMESRIGDQQTQALMAGANYRISVLKTLAAVLHSAKLYLEAKASLATGAVSPMELANLGKGLVDVVLATLAAVREKMGPLEFVISVVLSEDSQGVSATDLRHKVRDFLNAAEPARLPWYLGLTTDLLRDAKEIFEYEGGFEAKLLQLDKDGFLQREGEVLVFKERHFVWGFSIQ